MATTSPVTVGYWNMRGRAGVVRSLLAYCGIPFTNKIYSNKGEWFGKDKEILGIDYPNLPYLIDGDKKISESVAILHYIALKAGKRELIGDTDEKLVKVQTAIGVIGDLRSFIVKIFFSKGDVEAETRQAFTNGPLQAKLEFLNKNLEGKEWLIGSFSIADFELFEALNYVDRLDAFQVENYSNLVAFRKRFCQLPEYKAHRASAEFIA